MKDEQQYKNEMIRGQAKCGGLQVWLIWRQFTLLGEVCYACQYHLCYNVLYNEKSELVYMHQDNLRGVQDRKMIRDDTESF